MLGLMVPGEATIVPLFITVNGMHMIDSVWQYAGYMMLIYVAGFMSVSEDVLEAARIDGANELRTFFVIALPLSKTIISTVCIFSFIGSWNNYLWPLLCAMNESLFTLPIGIPTFAGTYTVDYVRPLTASMVASLPMIIIYVIFEKQIVAGITAGAVKG